MSLTSVLTFSAGFVAAGYLIAALLFLRYWRLSRDGLFLSFAAAFLLLALNQALPALLNVPKENQSPFYLLRLAGFAVIILAIVRKNMKRRR